MPTREKPPAAKCGPCSDEHHGECEGPKRCNCMICSQIKPVAEDMERDWQLGEQAKHWPE